MRNHHPNLLSRTYLILFYLKNLSAILRYFPDLIEVQEISDQIAFPRMYTKNEIKRSLYVYFAAHAYMTYIYCSRLLQIS